MKLYRYAFVGKMGSGKSTAAEELVEVISEKEGPMMAYILKFADPIYQVLHILNKDHIKPRKFMQEFGDLARKMFGENIFCELLANDYNRIITHDVDDNAKVYIAVDDVRFIDEAEMLEDLGFTLIRIECPENIAKERLGRTWVNKNHRSEKEQENIVVPHIILNVGEVKDLRRELREIVFPPEYLLDTGNK